MLIEILLTQTQTHSYSASIFKHWWQLTKPRSVFSLLALRYEKTNYHNKATNYGESSRSPGTPRFPSQEAFGDAVVDAVASLTDLQIQLRDVEREHSQAEQYLKLFAPGDNGYSDMKNKVSAVNRRRSELIDQIKNQKATFSRQFRTISASSQQVPTGPSAERRQSDISMGSYSDLEKRCDAQSVIFTRMEKSLLSLEEKYTDLDVTAKWDLLTRLKKNLDKDWDDIRSLEIKFENLDKNVRFDRKQIDSLEKTIGAIQKDKGTDGSQRGGLDKDTKESLDTLKHDVTAVTENAMKVIDQLEHGKEEVFRLQKESAGQQQQLEEQRQQLAGLQQQLADKEGTEREVIKELVESNSLNHLKEHLSAFLNRDIFPKVSEKVRSELKGVVIDSPDFSEKIEQIVEEKLKDAATRLSEKTTTLDGKIDSSQKTTRDAQESIKGQMEAIEQDMEKMKQDIAKPKPAVIVDTKLSERVKSLEHDFTTVALKVVQALEPKLTDRINSLSRQLEEMKGIQPQLTDRIDTLGGRLEDVVGLVSHLQKLKSTLNREFEKLSTELLRGQESMNQKSLQVGIQLQALQKTPGANGVNLVTLAHNVGRLEEAYKGQGKVINALANRISTITTQDMVNKCVGRMTEIYPVLDMDHVHALFRHLEERHANDFKILKEGQDQLNNLARLLLSWISRVRPMLNEDGGEQSHPGVQKIIHWLEWLEGEIRKELNEDQNGVNGANGHAANGVNGVNGSR